MYRLFVPRALCPPLEALARLEALAVQDVAEEPGGLVALLPAAPELALRVRELGLGADLAPARAHDDGSVWRLSARRQRVGAFWIEPAGGSELASAPGPNTLWLSDGEAFGTGEHPSTALILERLSELELAGGVLDVGTGSGILALAALRRGASHAIGVDLDPSALLEARRNAELNGLGSRFEARLGGPAAAPGRYPLVLANMVAGTLIALAPALSRAVGSGGELVVSGVAVGLAEEVERALLHHGLRRGPRDSRGGWARLSFWAGW